MRILHALRGAKLDEARQQRREELYMLQPDLAALESKLLRLGGERVVLFALETHLRQITDYGKSFDTKHAPKLLRMEDSQCHMNCAMLWRKLRSDGYRICAGYGLSDDGLWRQHSWMIDKDAHVFETTEVREKYYGAVLSDDDALRFALTAAPYVVD